MFLLNAPITAVREVARGMFVISMEAPEIAATVRAGQFVNLGWAGAFLRRPFSVYRVDGDRIEIVLKAVGRGTAQLLAMRRGRCRQLPGSAGSRLRPGRRPAHRGAGQRRPRRRADAAGGEGGAPTRHARDLGARRSQQRGALLGVRGRRRDLGHRRRISRRCRHRGGRRAGWRRRAGLRAESHAGGGRRPLAASARGGRDVHGMRHRRLPWLCRAADPRAATTAPARKVLSIAAADIDWAALPSHLPYAVTA